MAAIEKVASCVETFAHNHPDVPILHKDIRMVTSSDLQAIGVNNVDIVTAGMPCETFSTAGSKSRSFYDERQMLFSQGIRIAALLNAKVILLENVPAITSKKVSKDSNKLIVDLIYEQLADSGYKFFIETILDASDFGVPQRRRRFFILASRNKIQLTSPISTRSGVVSIREAFSELPPIQGNAVESTAYVGNPSRYSKLMRDKEFWTGESAYNDCITFHITPKHRPNTIKRFRMIRPGEGLKDLFDRIPKKTIISLQKAKVLPGKWYIQRNRRLKLDEPSHTVTSHCLDELVHPFLDRALTVREVARLQSFPDHYEFVGGPFLCPHVYETQDKYEQVGDAVPPLLAYEWGLTIQSIIRNLPVVC